MTTWEGGLRLPMMVRWPGHIPERSELNGIQSHEDVFVTLAAAAGVPDIARRLADGHDLGTDVTYRVYIDGIDQLDYWTGASPTSARDHVLYYSETSLQAIRWRQWTLHFATRNGYYGVTTQLELPWVFNVRQDPFESYEQAPGPRATITQHKTYLGGAIAPIIAEHISSLRKYPPRQRPATLNLARRIEAIMSSL